jgi:hypothetical protein
MFVFLADEPGQRAGLRQMSLAISHQRRPSGREQTWRMSLHRWRAWEQQHCTERGPGKGDWHEEVG